MNNDVGKTLPTNMNSDIRLTLPASMNTKVEHTLATNDEILMVMSLQASIGDSFHGLTILVVIPLDPRFPRTTYAGMTATDLKTRNLPDPCIYHRDGVDSDFSEELSKTKNQLLGDFILKNNIVSLQFLVLALEVN